MLYLTRSYGIGSELQLNNKASIYSLPTAKFVSVNGNSRGLTFVFGGKQRAPKWQPSCVYRGWVDRAQ